MLRLTQTWGRGVISFHKFIHALLISNPEARRVTTSGDSRMKKTGGGHCGAKESRGSTFWSIPNWPPLLDCYCQKTDVLCSPVVLFQNKGSLMWNNLWVWPLKERSKSSRTQPRDSFIPLSHPGTLFTCRVRWRAERRSLGHGNDWRRDFSRYTRLDTLRK